MRGRVVLTFNVHRNGALTDVRWFSRQRSNRSTRAAVNALLASNPTEPLPPEYPADKAFFTVTFYYNESPGRAVSADACAAAGCLIVPRCCRDRAVRVSR